MQSLVPNVLYRSGACLHKRICEPVSDYMSILVSYRLSFFLSLRHPLRRKWTGGRAFGPSPVAMRPRHYW